MEAQKVYFQKQRPDARLPYRATDESAGYDLAACMDGPVEVRPGETVMVHTGLVVLLPRGAAGMVYPRSGLAVKSGVTLPNCVGVIDSDYRGELMVPLFNHGGQTVTIFPGDRVAQLVVTPVLTPEVAEYPMDAPLPASGRGAGGFGSTGVHEGADGR